MNRLAQESSPYLRLHAENPVDWYPWGEEAFEKARREGKPIFLSVGYSTCYWCHVMERESFSNPETAGALNEAFVSIKLDREERPDLDEVYMTATQLMTQQGGWPNSLFLTPDLKPFFAGTYFPPQDAHGRPGFPRILRAVREAWETRRESVLEQADEVARVIAEHLGPGPAGDVPREDAVVVGETGLKRRFDRKWGGFGGAPKFPSPSNLFFLLERAEAGGSEAGSMLTATLRGMAQGGIHDQIGGGFHRYSTDARWLVPHFEKMLYDNASLALLYAEASRVAPGEGFERVARRTLDFVLRELRSEEGAFLSAIDAETDAHEGAYYTWSKAELEKILLPEDYALLAAVYGFDGEENFEGERYVLHLPVGLSERAELLGMSLDTLLEKVERGSSALMKARWTRKRPLVDDKVLCDWNSLMIQSMARAGSLLSEPRYTEAARVAAEVILSRLRVGGRLAHVYREGHARVPALLDDYAFLIAALLALHKSSGEKRWLDEAVRLQEEQEEHLGDPLGAYAAAPEDPSLLVRGKTAHDGALPAGNGVAVLNLLDLGQLTQDSRYGDRARRALGVFSGAIAGFPLAHVTLLRAVARLGFPPVVEGAVEVEGALLHDGEGPWREFSVELVVPEGWHLNARETKEASLIPTTVSSGSGDVRALRYPTGVPYGPDRIPVYQGRIRIQGEVETKPGEAPYVVLTYQPCDDARCLPTLHRTVPLVASSR